MAISYNPDKADVNNCGYLSGAVTVGTVEVEAKVGGSALEERQLVTIYNDSNSTVFYGPTGVTTSTGKPLFKKQSVEITNGPDNPVFLIAGSNGNDVIVQEYS